MSAAWKRTHAGYYRTYIAWRAMMQRCTNTKYKGYHNYGGRGIVVCRRWGHFRNFLADMGNRPSRFTLDRKNTNGNYTKGNCRWLSKREQAFSRRTNIMLTYKGKRQHVAQWARDLGINESILYTRIKKGWSTQQVLGTEVKIHTLGKIKLQGVSRTISEWAKTLGLPYSAFLHRWRRNWTFCRLANTPVMRKRSRV